MTHMYIIKIWKAKRKIHNDKNNLVEDSRFSCPC